MRKYVLPLFYSHIISGVGLLFFLIPIPPPSNLYATGKVWRSTNGGLKGAYITAMTIDPSSPQTIYAAVRIRVEYSRAPMREAAGALVIYSLFFIK
jgi:hypothetical protein